MRGSNKADREFVSEAEEILETMRGGLADLSDRLGAGVEADPELINAMFRAAHSLKALAGMFRFDPISTLAHRLEDVLDGMRLGRVALAPPVLEAIEDTVTLFGSLLSEVGDSEALASSAARIEELTARIATATAARSEPANEFASLDLDPNVLRALTDTRSTGCARTCAAGATSRSSTRRSRSEHSRRVSPSSPRCCARTARCSRRCLPRAIRSSRRSASRCSWRAIGRSSSSPRASSFRACPCEACGRVAPRPSTRPWWRLPWPPKRRAPSRRRVRVRRGVLHRPRIAQVDQRHGARRHPQARRAHEPGR